MPSVEIELPDEAQLLVLASADMKQAAAAARQLQRTFDIHTSRALETAIAVCYWRPFSNNCLGTLEDRWLPMLAAPEAR